MVALETGGGRSRSVDAVPDKVASFREAYRGEHIGRGYSGVLHFAFTSVGSLTVIAIAAAAVHSPTFLELLTVPLTFLFANYVEYRGHRGPMHRRMRGLSLLFERHTLQHHRYYTHDAMAYETTRDFKVVLFPPVMLLFFLGAVAAPVAALLFLFVTRNAASLYVMTAMSYFLTYEWLHLCHHTPRGGVIDRIGFLRQLRLHHRAHHDPAVMTSANFNITFPICDWLFGTRAVASGRSTTAPPHRALSKMKLPTGWHCLTPRIVTADVAGLLDFVRLAFGATGKLEADRPAVMRIGDSVVMISGVGPRAAMPAFLYLYVDDADATFLRAIDLGATSLEAPTDMPYGDRRAMIEDRWGNVWQIATFRREE